MCTWWIWMVLQLRATIRGWRNSFSIRPIPPKLKSFAWTKWLVTFLLVMDGGVGSHEKRSCTSSSYGRLVGQTGDQQSSSVDQPFIAFALGTRGLGASTATYNGVSCFLTKHGETISTQRNMILECWRRKPPAPSVMDNIYICWRMFGHIERSFRTYWALFSSVWGYLGPIWGYVGPIWGYVAPMWAYLGLMLGLCWAYLDPFLAYIGPDQEFWHLLKNMQKHRVLEQKCPPPS